MQITGHTILITGGASGIGLALTKNFIQYNNEVIVIGRDEQKLNRLKTQYPSIITYLCNVGLDADLQLLINQLQDNHPKLNVIINNAGIQYNYAAIEGNHTWQQVDEEIAINLNAPIKLTSQLLSLLASQSEAAIVNVTSGLALTPKKSAPIYCATKAGLHIFTKALRYQLEHTNIKVFEIIPPVVDTDMTKGRGTNKISADQLAAQFLTFFKKDRLEVPIGKVKWLIIINRWFPSIAERILKNS